MTMKQIFLVFLALTVSACTTVRTLPTNALSPGMNKNDVEKVLGKPHNVQEEGTKMLWEYCSTHYLYSNYVEIWYELGFLIKVERESRPIGYCKNGFREDIDWDKAPSWKASNNKGLPSL